MSSSSDISISFGADLSTFLHSMREMIESVKTTMAEIRNHFVEVNRAGKEAKQAFIYAADGSEILLDKSKKATNSVKSQDKAWADCSRTIQEVVQNARKVAPAVDGVKASIKTTYSPMERIAQMSTAIRNSFRIATVAATALRNAVVVPLREFSRFEDAATRMAPLVGGLDSAKILCAQLRDEAANGTMSFEQLASVAGRLASVFKSSSDIKKWTTAFHDLSAGTGLDINELVGNFTKLKAAGRVTGEFPEMFAQKGVNIFGELEKQTGKTAAELRKMAQEGTLSFSEIEKALETVATGEGKFAGQAAAMSNTFGGSVGTMTENWKMFLAEVGKPIAAVVKFFVKPQGEIPLILRDIMHLGSPGKPFTIRAWQTHTERCNAPLIPWRRRKTPLHSKTRRSRRSALFMTLPDAPRSTRRLSANTSGQSKKRHAPKSPLGKLFPFPFRNFHVLRAKENEIVQFSSARFNASERANVSSVQESAVSA